MAVSKNKNRCGKQRATYLKGNYATNATKCSIFDEGNRGNKDQH